MQLSYTHTKMKKEITKIMFEIKYIQTELEDIQTQLNRIIPYEDGIYYYNKKLKLQSNITNQTKELIKKLDIFMSFFGLEM